MVSSHIAFAAAASPLQAARYLKYQRGEETIVAMRPQTGQQQQNRVRKVVEHTNTLVCVTVCLSAFELFSYVSRHKTL